MSRIKIALLGFGAMGSRIAMKLLENNYQITIWNRSPINPDHPALQQGAKIATTPKDAVKDIDFAISMVRDNEASLRVWTSPNDGALLSLPAHSVAIESSTLSLNCVRNLTKEFSEHRRQFLHAPVIGSRTQTETSNLIYLVGGASRDFAKSKAIFSHLASSIYHVGTTDSAAILKLCVNSMLGVQVALLAELLGMTEKLHLSRKQMVDIITAMPSCSMAIKVAAQSMLEKTFEPLFPIELVEKDLAYLKEIAANSTKKIPVINTAHEIFLEAKNKGLGDKNITGVLGLYV